MERLCLREVVREYYSVFVASLVAPTNRTRNETRMGNA